jgi:hypothetical protein
MMLYRRVVINFIYSEIFIQAIKQLSTGRGDAPTHRWRRADAKILAAAPAKTRRRRGWRGVGL